MEATNVILTAEDLDKAKEDMAFPQWQYSVEGTDTTDAECRVSVLISHGELDAMRISLARKSFITYHASSEQVARKLTMGSTGEDALCMPVEYSKPIGTIEFTTDK